MKRSEFILHNIEWAKGILAEPCKIFPNGKKSHDVARQELIRREEEWDDYCLNYGLFNANGKRVGFIGE